MNKQTAEQIWDYYVGGHVSSKEFLKDGQVSMDAIEQQIDFCREQGWIEHGDLPGGTLNITANELREAIRTLANEDLD